MQIVEKADLTQRELNSLHPDYGLFDGVNWDIERYYKDFNTGKIYEFRLCTDGSYNKRIEELKTNQRKQKMLSLLIGKNKTFHK